MKINHLLLLPLALILLGGCKSEPISVEEIIEKVNENPAAEGFDLENSDEKAIVVADKVMKAMGGRKNWDATEVISWNFFGKRKHFWNKKTGDIRIELAEENTVLLCNINSMEGKALIEGKEITSTDSLSMYMNLAKEMWVNDSYWLFMPFKLKDSGVRLKYRYKKALKNNEYAHAIELTFKDVGFTPNNKYMIYIDPIDNLVIQWDFYQDTVMDNPVFSTSWENYQQYGDILLSSVRNNDTLTEINVFEEVPTDLFSDF